MCLHCLIFQSITLQCQGKGAWQALSQRHARSGWTCSKSPPALRCLAQRALWAGLFKKVINAHKQGSSGARTAALTGAQPTLKLAGQKPDEEPETNHSQSPCEARALGKPGRPGRISVCSQATLARHLCCSISGNEVFLQFPSVGCSAVEKVPVPSVTLGRHLTPLSLSFLICSVGMGMCTHLPGLWKDRVNTSS